MSTSEMQARITALERELEQAKEDRARAAMDARNPLLASLAALKCDNARLYEIIRANRVPAYDRARQAREDEAWAHSGHVGCIARGDDGWVASRWNVEMQSMDQVNAPTIHAALRAIRAKVEGGAR